MNDHLGFQYCPKLAVLSADGQRVLLCRRRGEQDYDGVFSLIGGKMEHTDPSIVGALHREKLEEVGPDFRLRLLPNISVDVLFVKSDGSHMILPHYLAFHLEGNVSLSDEYSEYDWVQLDALADFEPKIANLAWIVPLLARLRGLAEATDFVEI